MLLRRQYRNAAMRTMNGRRSITINCRASGIIQGSTCAVRRLDSKATTTTTSSLLHQFKSSHWFSSKCTDGGCDDSDPASIDHIFQANREWVDQVNKEDPNIFPELGKGQSPQFLYIGCSDSRLAINALTGLGMGSVFVHRNIANMVVSADMNLLSVLTYAVVHLNVRHILVTGHYDCGGIRASMKKQDLGPVLDAWLQNIRDVYRLHKTELDAIEDEEARHCRLVELNVMEQCLNLYKTSVVQRKRLETYKDPSAPFTYPRIHGLVFDPSTGVLFKIPIDFRRELSELSSMYDLFDADDFESPYMLKKGQK